MIECEWCGGKEAPFRKLIDKGYICNDCYKGLEGDRILFDYLDFNDRER